MFKLTHLLTACMLIMLLSVSINADPIIDRVGDFIPTYAGPLNGDLDVVTAEVTLTGTTLVFSSRSAAPIGTTPDGFFVWGIDRGAGTARFGIITTSQGTYDASGVLFDSVVVIRPGGASAVNDLISGVSTQLLPGDITISGNDLLARVSLSLLPSRGLQPGEYTVNLWPRFGGNGVTGNPQISDFAPDNSNTRVTTVPEPTAVVLLSIGLAGVSACVRRRRRSANQTKE